MLQTIRDRASGWFAYAIVFLISVPFALWGINHYLDGGGKQVAAKVGDTTISLAAFGQAYRDEQARLAQMFGGQLPPNVTDKMVKQLALRQLVQETLLAQVVDDAGYKVTNQELLKQIVSFPVFQQDGNFSKTRYEQILAAQGMTPAVFEKKLRRQLAIEQFQSGIVDTAFATQSEAEDAIKLEGEKRQVAMTVIPLSRFFADIKIKPEAIKAYYKQHQSEYMTSQKVRVSYLRLKESDLAGTINPDAEALKQYYRDHRAKFAKPERAVASEIVLDIPTGKAEREKKMSLAAHIRSLSMKGDSFSELAKRYSQNQGNAGRGGEMGQVTRADLPNALADALFSLKPGETSKPIELDGKLYLLKLEQLLPAEQQTFAEAESRVRHDYVASQARGLFEKQQQRLSELAYEHPGTLEPAAKSLGLPIKQSDWFTQSGGAGVAANAQVLKAAFSNAVLSNGTNSGVIQISKGDVLVLRIADKQAPQPMPLKSVQSRISGILERDAAENDARKLAKQLRDAVAGGKDLKAVSTEHHLSFRALGWLSRGDRSLPSNLVQAAFRSPPPASANQPSVGSVKLNDGGYAVFSVNRIDWPAVDSSKASAMLKTLGTGVGQTEMSVLFQSLEKSVDVRIYPNNINL
ncbi:SurA N-terminal domain-containing protein [Acidihalobacter prosperus]|uniref:Periplasmic chaperone PpiD n=1 Tax=Acidihalobacter prosperus TaxID=160660 RepID=A0A1A6C6Y7_9GAMM|nr:SurA N-terminal domain-containing protein [Acidihalobacter prosperus]OBS10310.1 hypothetical protein Thpro_020026 [Acidihalobacter prosperus]